jgi:hypothetical protein
MKKLTMIPEEEYNICKGCCFNKGSEKYDWTCKHKRQSIDNNIVNCGTDRSIYKEEKEMNKMPALESGNIVTWRFSGEDLTSLYLSNSLSMNIDRDTWTSNDLLTHNIIAIYEVKSGSFNDIRENMNLIWSRKSDKDIKIEALQKKMDEISKEMEELKG